MSNPALLDGSDGSVVSPLYTTLKRYLAEALHILDSLDSSSLDKLKDDDEYKKSVQRLLIPLTPTPLSQLVGQVDRIIQSGLGGISAQISTLFPSVLPPTIPTHLPKAAHSLSSTASPLEDTPIVGETTHHAVTASPKIARPLSATTATRPPQKSLQDVLIENKGAMMTFWIHLITGNWHDSIISSNMPLDSLNKEMHRRKRERVPMKWYPALHALQHLIQSKRLSQEFGSPRTTIQSWSLVILPRETGRIRLRRDSFGSPPTLDQRTIRDTHESRREERIRLSTQGEGRKVCTCNHPTTWIAPQGL